MVLNLAFNARCQGHSSFGTLICFFQTKSMGDPFIQCTFDLILILYYLNYKLPFAHSHIARLHQLCSRLASFGSNKHTQTLSTCISRTSRIHITVAVNISTRFQVLITFTLFVIFVVCLIYKLVIVYNNLFWKIIVSKSSLDWLFIC